MEIKTQISCVQALSRSEHLAKITDDDNNTVHFALNLPMKKTM